MTGADSKQLFAKLVRACFPMLILIGLIPFRPALFAQERQAASEKKIEILSFSRMGKKNDIDPDLIIFSGNVRIRHNEALMSCDSAYHYDNRNQVEAFGRVHIEQGDTLDLYGDYIFYEGNSGNAFVLGNVKLLNKDTRLLTDRLNYNVNDRIAYYDSEGRINDDRNELLSEKGVYYASDHLFHFSRSVLISGPDYTITADIMNYDSENEIVYFTGPTHVSGDSIKIFAKGGWYDSRARISRLWDSALVDNLRQVIKGDTIYYEEDNGFAEAKGSVVISDTANNSVVRGHYALYNKDPESLFVTDSALYILEGSKDTLFLHADTLRSVSVTDPADSTLQYRLVRAYYGSRIFSHDFQACADSLSYSFRDSTIRLYRDPVIWSEENQMTADSIVLYTRNSQMDRMELYSGAFVASRVDSLRFNQIKGRELTGFFEENKLVKVIVEGNGESVYFLIDNDEMIGVNHSKSSSIEIGFSNGQIVDITEYGDPDGVLEPPLQRNPEDVRLGGFKWLERLRPFSLKDLFRKN